MNDDPRDERVVRDFFAETAPSRSPDELLDDVFLSTGRMRPRSRWLALLKEPPMRISSTLAVGSPTARVAAILAATLLLALSLIAAGIAGSRLLAADDAIIVAQDGSGAVTTIAAGIAMAQDGDTVLVRPGTYTEAVVIDSDITLAGDGPREEVIVRIPDDGPFEPWPLPIETAPDPFPELRYGIFLSGSDATVTGLTVTGPNRSVTGFLVRGGSPTISGNVVDLDPARFISARGLAYIGGGSNVTLIDNVTDAFIWIDEGASATVVGNSRLEDGADEVGIRVENASATITGNDLNGVFIHPGGVAEVRDNVLTGPAPECLVTVVSAGSGVVVEGNQLSAATQGVCVEASAGAVIRDNEIRDMEILGAMIRGGEVTFAGNTIGSSGLGVAIRGGSPRLEGNVVEGNRVGLALLDGATPILVGNRSCGNGRNLNVPEDAEPPVIEGNEICADTPAEG